MAPLVPPGRIRISCAALCRIVDARGRYLLGLNRDRLAQGKRIYMALGGALEYSDPALIARFDAIPEDPASRDLRLFLEPARLDEFHEWFLAREGRETTPFRELREELVEEFAALPHLAPDDVDMRYAHSYERTTTTDRSTAPGAPTHYLHEVFDVTFLHSDHRTVLDTLPIESGLRWLTQNDIERGIDSAGTQVDARPLLAGT